MKSTEEFLFTDSIASAELIAAHLHACERDFVPCLSSYVDIDAYALKLFKSSRRIEAWHDKVIAALLCYYADKKKPIFISNLSVLSFFANRGLASQMLEILKSLALSQSCKRIELEVYRINERAIKFYKMHHFCRIGGNLNTDRLVLSLG